MVQNLRHLKQLYLHGWNLSDFNVRLMTKNVPSLKTVRVQNKMFVCANVTQSELQDFFKGYQIFNRDRYEKQGILETELF